ncbi:MAG: hypothetical protein MUP22_10635 [Desulfobacterales bacterium]|nr:hypothetical protein [Desulfobacterales bacterium]
MIKFYTNRELSGKLGISLAKWKRWSREFLPPDPLGGMQSGFARQYYFDDAFYVMLGGHLVGHLHYSVYEARHIIEALKDWIIEKGFSQDPLQLHEGRPLEPPVTKYRIFIQRQYLAEKNKPDFLYRIRGIIYDKPVEHNGIEAREERYVETVVGSVGKTSREYGTDYEKILDISDLYKDFTKRLGYQQKK